MVFFFWKKDHSKTIRNALQLLKNDLQQLKTPQAKIASILATIRMAKEELKHIEKEIRARGEEEKSKPWIGFEFDRQIDELVKKEVAAVQGFSEDLLYYEDYAVEAAAGKDSKVMAEDVKAIFNSLEEEETAIEAREKEAQVAVQAMERETLRERLRERSVSPLSLSTKDKVPWANIVTVARELGGWLEPAGRHAQALRFY